MKSLLFLFAVLCSSMMMGADDEFARGMKAVKASMDALNKMEKMSGEKAMESAERIGYVYENMIQFWRQRNAPDAVKISEKGKAAAAMLASAAYAGDTEKASAALKAIGDTCAPCHESRRIKTPEGPYRIK